MKNRYHMESRDKKFFIEGEFHQPGYNYLRKIRSTDNRFKHMLIKSVIQTEPNKIPLYEIIERN
jgi:hypothetical protein